MPARPPLTLVATLELRYAYCEKRFLTLLSNLAPRSRRSNPRTFYVRSVARARAARGAAARDRRGVPVISVTSHDGCAICVLANGSDAHFRGQLCARTGVEGT